MEQDGRHTYTIRNSAGAGGRHSASPRVPRAGSRCSSLVVYRAGNTLGISPPRMYEGHATQRNTAKRARKNKIDNPRATGSVTAMFTRKCSIRRETDCQRAVVVPRSQAARQAPQHVRSMREKATDSGSRRNSAASRARRPPTVSRITSESVDIASGKSSATLGGVER